METTGSGASGSVNFNVVFEYINIFWQIKMCFAGPHQQPFNSTAFPHEFFDSQVIIE